MPSRPTDKDSDRHRPTPQDVQKKISHFYYRPFYAILSYMTEKDRFDELVEGLGPLAPDTQALVAATDARESIAEQNELIDLLIAEGLVTRILPEVTQIRKNPKEIFTI